MWNWTEVDFSDSISDFITSKKQIKIKLEEFERTNGICFHFYSGVLYLFKIRFTKLLFLSTVQNQGGFIPKT